MSFFINLIRKSVTMKRENIQNNFLLKLVLVVSLATISVAGFYLFNASRYQKNVELVSIDKGSSVTGVFKLRKNATEYQKERFEVLTESMKNNNVPEQDIAALIAENFIIDFFTWTNKVHFNDVGGLQYIENSIAPSVMNQAIHTFYNDFHVYLEKGTHKSTLEVASSSTDVVETEYMLQRQIINDVSGKETQKEIIKDGYLVTVSWEYKMMPNFSTDGYQQQAKIIVVKDDTGVLRIMEVSNEEI